MDQDQIKQIQGKHDLQIIQQLIRKLNKIQNTLKQDTASNGNPTICAISVEELITELRI